MKKLFRDDSGAATIEFSILTPLFVAMAVFLVIIYDFINQAIDVHQELYYEMRSAIDQDSEDEFHKIVKRGVVSAEVPGTMKNVMGYSQMRSEIKLSGFGGCYIGRNKSYYSMQGLHREIIKSNPLIDNPVVEFARDFINTVANLQYANEYYSRLQQVDVDGNNIVVGGIKIGTFDENSDLNKFRNLLSGINPSEYRNVTANEGTIQLPNPDGGDPLSFKLTDKDAAAMGLKTAAEAAKAVAGNIKGTWVRGVYTEVEYPNRAVLPVQMDPEMLYYFSQSAGEGPGRSKIDTENMQVNIVGLRGVGTNGEYDPKLKSFDDTIIVMATDRDGNHYAIRFEGAIDPAKKGGTSQIGDSTAIFKYTTDGNPNLKGTPQLQPFEGPQSPPEAGIEVKYSDLGINHYYLLNGASNKIRKDENRTKYHIGTDVFDSQGCPLIRDEGTWGTVKKEVTRIAKLELEKLTLEDVKEDLSEDYIKQLRNDLGLQDDADLSNEYLTSLNIETIESIKEEIEVKDDGNFDKTKYDKTKEILNLRRHEEAKIAENQFGTDSDEYQHAAANIDGVEKPKDGDDYPEYIKLSTGANYKAFLSVIYRDPGQKIRVVHVDGSKVETFSPPDIAE